jgi:hypothetical protein
MALVAASSAPASTYPCEPSPGAMPGVCTERVLIKRVVGMGAN